MRLLVLLAAVAMPVVAWLSQRGTFGPDNGTISDRYPTLLVAAGYAFSVWGLIFLLDLVFAIWQLRAPARDDATLRRVRPSAAAGFALTAAWMPIFSAQIFWLAILVIVGSAASLLHAAIVASRDAAPLRVRVWAWLPLSLHAGWLSLAAFMNAAQVIVAYRLLPTDVMLPWSLGLLAAALGVLLWVNHQMRGNVAYVAVALWGLVAVFIRQSASSLPGAVTVGWAALVLAVVVVGQTAWLLRARWRRA